MRVAFSNTFPPDLTAVQVISKQLHGNHGHCQENLCCNSCCTSRGHDRPPGPQTQTRRSLTRELPAMTDLWVWTGSWLPIRQPEMERKTIAHGGALVSALGQVRGMRRSQDSMDFGLERPESVFVVQEGRPQSTPRSLGSIPPLGQHTGNYKTARP